MLTLKIIHYDQEQIPETDKEQYKPATNEYWMPIKSIHASYLSQKAIDDLRSGMRNVPEGTLLLNSVWQTEKCPVGRSLFVETNEKSFEIILTGEFNIYLLNEEGKTIDTICG